MANKKEELSAEERISDRIAEFVQKKKDLIIGLLIFLVILIIVVVISVSSTNKAKEKAQIRIDELEQRYEAYVQDNSEESYEELSAALLKAEKGKRYPSAKAAYLLGLLQASEKDYSSAIESFEKCYKIGKKINKDFYLSALALLNEAVCEEELNNTEKALELYEKVTEFKDNGAAPKAIFSMGRIYYESSKLDLAKSSFQLLADQYPYSEYSKLAQNILDLN